MNVPSENHKVSLAVNSITQKIQQKKKEFNFTKGGYEVFEGDSLKSDDMYVNCG